MTSIGSYTKQIPLNNGYFRCLYALSAVEPSTLIFTPSGTTSDGRVSSMVLNTIVGPTNLSTSLFKDMGSQAVVNGSTFRRLQVVGASGATSGVTGAATGVDSDYLSFYILTGFNGAGAPGSPFIRTG
jgi:hypothetical protein